MFYVYQYLREDGTPYYIGKGNGNRAWANHSRKNGSNILPKDKSKIEIIKDNLTEEEANIMEISLIERYGRKDLGTGILINLTDGGDGTSGHVRPQSAIDSHREKLKGRKRPKELVRRIDETHRGKKRSDETKQKQREIRLGTKDSEETRLKKSEAAKKPKSKEHAENIRLSKIGEKNPMFGKTSPNKGKKMSEEQKEKIRQTLLKRQLEKSSKD